MTGNEENQGPKGYRPPRSNMPDESARELGLVPHGPTGPLGTQEMSAIEFCVKSLSFSFLTINTGN